MDFPKQSRILNVSLWWPLWEGRYGPFYYTSWQSGHMYTVHHFQKLEGGRSLVPYINFHAIKPIASIEPVYALALLLPMEF